MTNRVLILFAHPALQKSSVNRRLITAVRNPGKRDNQRSLRRVLVAQFSRANGM